MMQKSLLLVGATALSLVTSSQALTLTSDIQSELTGYITSDWGGLLEKQAFVSPGTYLQGSPLVAQADQSLTVYVAGSGAGYQNNALYSLINAVETSVVSGITGNTSAGSNPIFGGVWNGYAAGNLLAGDALNFLLKSQNSANAAFQYPAFGLHADGLQYSLSQSFTGGVFGDDLWYLLAIEDLKGSGPSTPQVGGGNGTSDRDFNDLVVAFALKKTPANVPEPAGALMFSLLLVGGATVRRLARK